MTCFFIGHRNAPESIFPLITEAVEKEIALNGMNDIVVGHYGHFDSMAARAVRAAKETHADFMKPHLIVRKRV